MNEHIGDNCVKYSNLGGNFYYLLIDAGLVFDFLFGYGKRDDIIIPLLNNLVDEDGKIVVIPDDASVYYCNFNESYRAIEFIIQHKTFPYCHSVETAKQIRFETKYIGYSGEINRPDVYSTEQKYYRFNNLSKTNISCVDFIRHDGVTRNRYNVFISADVVLRLMTKFDFFDDLRLPVFKKLKTVDGSCIDVPEDCIIEFNVTCGLSSNCFNFVFFHKSFPAACVGTPAPRICCDEIEVDFVKVNKCLKLYFQS